jgi:hypothetical protein
MSNQHLYRVKLKNEEALNHYDDRDLDEYTKYLKSGDATLLNGALQVNPDDLIEVKELPNIDTQHVG